MAKFITKETISRLLKDVKDIMKHPLTDNGIYYVHDDTDMLKGYALIVGPEDTPYFGGSYFFEFNYPFDYPHSPPQVKYWTNGRNIRFNPNLYACGKVCVSLLNTWHGDQWTSCQSISTVLLTLCTLLCPNPLLNEPGVNLSHADNLPYTEIIEYANIEIAVCDIIAKNGNVVQPFFEYFYPFVKEHFLKNYDKLTAFVEQKMEAIGQQRKVSRTKYYGMNVVLDYSRTLQRLQSLHAQITTKVANV